MSPVDREVFAKRNLAGAWPTKPWRRPGPSFVLVEDEVEHAVAFKRLLQLLAPTASVEHASDGLSAGLLLGTIVPEVAFVDIELPGLDGIDVIRKALERPALTETEYVVVSAHLSEERVRELRALGIRHILSKPVTPEQVRSVLEALGLGAAAEAELAAVAGAR